MLDCWPCSNFGSYLTLEFLCSLLSRPAWELHNTSIEDNLRDKDEQKFRNSCIQTSLNLQLLTAMIGMTSALVSAQRTFA